MRCFIYIYTLENNPGFARSELMQTTQRIFKQKENHRETSSFDLDLVAI